MTSSDNTEFSTIGLVGFGTIGAGVAEVFAASGRNVIAVDVDEARLQAGLNAVAASSGSDALSERITGSTRIADLATVDLVIEAVSEDSALKRELLAEISAVVGETTPIVTTTTGLSITDLAVSVRNPKRVAGLHFFHPVPATKTVEIIAGLQTDPGLPDRLVALVDSLGERTPIVVDDRPGFLIEAMVMPYLNDVINEFHDDLATAEDLDVALELGLGYKTGPLKMLDAIGLDAHLRATEAVYDVTADPRFSPPPLLRQMVAAGRLGNKSGHGFRVAPIETKDN